MHKLNVFYKSIVFSVAQNTIFRSSFFIFFVWLLSDTLIKTLFFWAIFANIQTIGGWTFEQCFLLVIFQGMMYDFSWMLFISAFNKFIERFSEGNFDFVLLKPMHPLTYITLTGFSASSFSGSRIILILYFIIFIPFVWLIPNTLAAILIFFCGIVALHACFAIMSTIIFYVIRGESIFELIYNIIDGGRYPFSIFPFALRVIFTFVIPIFLVANIPVMVLTNLINLNFAWIAILIAIALEIIAYKLWDFAIRHYTSASS